MNSKQAKEFIKALDALVAEKRIDKTIVIDCAQFHCIKDINLLKGKIIVIFFPVHTVKEIAHCGRDAVLEQSTTINQYVFLTVRLYFLFLATFFPFDYMATNTLCCTRCIKGTTILPKFRIIVVFRRYHLVIQLFCCSDCCVATCDCSCFCDIECAFDFLGCCSLVVCDC